jgi:hypothetical protein
MSRVRSILKVSDFDGKTQELFSKYYGDDISKEQARDIKENFVRLLRVLKEISCDQKV